MSTRPNIRKFFLDDARTPTRHVVAGDSICVRRASSTDATLTVYLDDDITPIVLTQDAPGFEGYRFESVRMEWSAQAGEWLELAFYDSPTIMLGVN